jgi:23S rRNA (cytidine1920-2'-O)/16S rRNA (cytidine1409-2'-O)-methyltransferase
VKSSTMVLTSDPIVVSTEAESHYVSRGAYKLIGALDEFHEIEVQGRSALDAGASTGGFTQVLLERGAERVLAVDVGYGQLAWPVRQDPRVEVLERTNVRHLTGKELPWRPDLVVADLSFISLTSVLPALAECAQADTDFVLMVKPQFEVGKDRIGDGVVRDHELRVSAVVKVVESATKQGLDAWGVVASPLPGPSGNVEYFLWLRKSGHAIGGRAPVDQSSMESEIRRAVDEGPQ